MERVDWNRHHTLFERRSHQKTHHNRRLRNHPGLVIPLPVVVHRELHAQVRPPIVPDKHLSDELLHHLDTSFSPAKNVFSGLLNLLGVIADQGNSLSEQAYQLRFNLLEQAEVMSVVYDFK